MQIILLSGGSGKRLWPLSNDLRSKQFIPLLPSGDGGRESMVQRVARQLRAAGLGESVTVATGAAQKDIIRSRLGPEVSLVEEPERRDTFPAIALSASYLAYEKGCPAGEIVVVMPCDPFTEAGYFETVRKMAEAVGNDAADLVLMGIRPDGPSPKYGYVVPESCGCAGRSLGDNIYKVSRFVEKPQAALAAELIAAGAFWNGGVFAFRLGYMMEAVHRYVDGESFEAVRSHYGAFPKTSFDYEVAEKAASVAVVPFDGKWKDIGTWDTLAGELGTASVGNVLMDDGSENTRVVNELGIPVVCIGAGNVVVAASYDGVLVVDKTQSGSVRSYADRLQGRPRYGETAWGEYRVLDETLSGDGCVTLTRKVNVRAGGVIPYRRHRLRDEVWSFVDGRGLVVLDGKATEAGRGNTVCINAGAAHGLKALTDLCFIELQTGSAVTDDDFEPCEWLWE